jgi:hypothetical protein
MWGWFVLSTLFIVLAQFRPFMAIALMCIYTEIPWSASWKPIVTIYPAYPFLLFLYIKYSTRIVGAVFDLRYRLVILLSALIIVWSFLSPVLYPASYGPSITFTQNPNYHRAITLLSLLLFIPAVLRSRNDIRGFLLSTIHVLIAIHILVVIATVYFLMSGHSLYELHLMRILNTPPVFWESGLLMLGLAYLLVFREISTLSLISLGILACIGLLLGNSRTRFLATFICLFYFLYPYISKRLIAWIVSLMLLLTASPILLPHNAKDYSSRLIKQRIEQSTTMDINKISSGRISTYKFTFERWKESPLVGVGSCYILPRTLDKAPRVHNYFLEILAGQGLLGLILLISVLVISFIIISHIGMKKAYNVVEGRFIVALFLYGLINWMFKESWGITYCTIAMLSVYSQTGE